VEVQGSEVPSEGWPTFHEDQEVDNGSVLEDGWLDEWPRSLPVEFLVVGVVFLDVG